MLTLFWQNFKAHFVRNVRHEETEGNARRRLRTSSVALSETRRLEKMRGQNGFDTNDPGPAAQFELSPAHVVRAFPTHHVPPSRLPILVLPKGRLLPVTVYVILVTTD
jgi:hypothetical protein|tara:strand:- start:779 stop:1102 length:324 start_codon:yes stop_codon:yes gene_type:complete